MKVLTLIRHAKSSWKDPNLADFDRPLNKRGKSDAPLMGRRLSARELFPDMVISSPAKRAVQTIKVVAGFIGFPEGRILNEERLYGAAADEILEVIRGLDDLYEHVVLCGHNPGLTDFSNLVANAFIENIPTCGVVRIRFPFDSWLLVAPGTGEIVFYDYPKNPLH